MTCAVAELRSLLDSCFGVVLDDAGWGAPPQPLSITQQLISSIQPSLHPRKDIWYTSIDSRLQCCMDECHLLRNVALAKCSCQKLPLPVTNLIRMDACHSTTLLVNHWC